MIVLFFIIQKNKNVGSIYAVSFVAVSKIETCCDKIFQYYIVGKK